MKYYSVVIPITWRVLTPSGLSPAYKWCIAIFGDPQKKRTKRGECQRRWLSEKDFAAGTETFYFDDPANATLFSLKWL